MQALLCDRSLSARGFILGLAVLGNGAGAALAEPGLQALLHSQYVCRSDRRWRQALGALSSAPSPQILRQCLAWPDDAALRERLLAPWSAAWSNFAAPAAALGARPRAGADALACLELLVLHAGHVQHRGAAAEVDRYRRLLTELADQHAAAARHLAAPDPAGDGNAASLARTRLASLWSQQKKVLRGGLATLTAPLPPPVPAAPGFLAAYAHHPAVRRVQHTLFAEQLEALDWHSFLQLAGHAQAVTGPQQARAAGLWVLALHGPGPHPAPQPVLAAFAKQMARRGRGWRGAFQAIYQAHLLGAAPYAAVRRSSPTMRLLFGQARGPRLRLRQAWEAGPQRQAVPSPAPHSSPPAWSVAEYGDFDSLLHQANRVGSTCLDVYAGDHAAYLCSRLVDGRHHVLALEDPRGQWQMRADFSLVVQASGAPALLLHAVHGGAPELRAACEAALRSVAQARARAYRLPLLAPRPLRAGRDRACGPQVFLYTGELGDYADAFGGPLPPNAQVASRLPLEVLWTPANSPVRDEQGEPRSCV